MALSFEESKKQAQEQSSLAATPMLMSLSYDANTLADETWQKPKNASFYTYYDDEYSDDKLSVVDENKNITLADSQINLTQEKNSQYIPFEIPRFYDGFDLATTELSIYWVNENGMGSSAIPVDVYHSADKIRFAWLVDDDVTAISGKIKFEIQASGKNSKGFNYLWKTKCNDGINVIQALEIKQFIEPDDTWQESFIRNLSTQASKAENARIKAEQAAKDAQAISDSLRSDLRDAASEVIGEDYYNKTEIDNKLANVEVDLTGYATEAYVQEQIDAIPAPDLSAYARMTDIPKKVSELVNDKNYLTEIPEQYITEDELTAKNYLTEIPSEYITETELNEKGYLTEIPSEYVTENELNEKGYLTEHQSLDAYATTTYVDDAVAAVDVSDQLKDYAKSADVYTKTEVDEAVANVQVDLSGYYTKIEVDSKTAGIETNTSNISSLSTTVTGIQETVNSIDKSPRKTYDVAYNDTEDPDVGENSFVLYEIENEGLTSESKIIKKKFTIVGGSGGGTSSTLKIEYITTSPIVATTSDNVIIKYNFLGTDSSGDAVTDGTATWKVGGRIVATNTAVAGENSFDITEYLSLGTQKVNLSITDDAGSLVTKTWTVQKIDVRIDSTFNDKLTYPIRAVSFDYTPYGAIAKTVYFILDGKQIGTVETSASGIPMGYTIPEQTHGSHLLEVYMTATVNDNVIESNHIYKDIIFYDSTSDIPVIGCTQQNFTALQYDSTNIVYTVYDPSTETPTVTLAVDGVVVSTLTLNSNTQIWQYKSSDVGPHVLTITCGEATKTLNVTIEKLDINIEPVTAGLEFDFNPSGHSNNDADRLWSDGDITMTVSDNFDWTNGGYQIDENGDQYFCVKSGTTATINYNLFADDPKKNGKEFKVVFKTTNIRKRDTSFISCMNNNIGLDMKVESANIYSSNNSLYSPYCEEDVIEFEFNINKNTDIPMVLTYEDGVGNRPMIYTSDASFMQSVPQPITIGSEDCDVYVYRMKAYSTSLSDRGILSNFIADARNADEAMQESSKTMDTISSEASELQNILHEITQRVNEVNTQILQISAAAEQQTTATAEISSNMKNITDGSKNLAYGNASINESVENTNQNVAVLTDIVNKFVI